MHPGSMKGAPRAGCCPHMTGRATRPSLVILSEKERAGAPRARVTSFSTKKGVRQVRTRKRTQILSGESSRITYSQGRVGVSPCTPKGMPWYSHGFPPVGKQSCHPPS